MSYVDKKENGGYAKGLDSPEYMEKFIRETDKKQEELNKTKSKISKREITEIKALSEKYPDDEYMDHALRGSIIQMSEKNEKNGVTDKNIEYMKAVEIAQTKTDKLSVFSLESPISQGAIIMLGFIFALIVAGTVTSMESMTRYKLFDESVPISKAKKYLAKTVFATGKTAIFCITQILIVFIIYKVSPYSDVLDMESFVMKSLKIVLLFSGLTTMFTFLGNYCGNLISYLGSSFIAFLGFAFLRFLTDLFTYGLLSGVIKIDKQQDRSFIIKTLDEMDYISPFRIMFKDYTPLSAVLMFFGLTVILVLVGIYISRYIKTERRGMFYTIKPVSYIYHILLTLTTSLILVNMFAGFIGNRQNIMLAISNWAIFILFALAFGKLYKYFFKAKLSI